MNRLIHRQWETEQRTLDTGLLAGRRNPLGGQKSTRWTPRDHNEEFLTERYSGEKWISFFFSSLTCLPKNKDIYGCPVSDQIRA